MHLEMRPITVASESSSSREVVSKILRSNRDKMRPLIEQKFREQFEELKTNAKAIYEAGRIQQVIGTYKGQMESHASHWRKSGWHCR